MKELIKQLTEMLGLEDCADDKSLYKKIEEEVTRLTLTERWVDQHMCSVCEDKGLDLTDSLNNFLDSFGFEREVK